MSRYDRLLELSSFSKEKLDILRGKNILIIGVGGVGQHLLEYLLTNGIEHATIVDFDKVELSNLNRQILVTEKDLDKPKVEVVKSALLARNSNLKIKTICKRVDINNINEIISNEYDVIIDAVDNWKTKLVIAKEVKDKKIPLLHVGVDGTSGQYALFKNKSLLDIVDEAIVNEPRDGVMGPMVGLISSMAALLLIDYLVGETINVDTLYHFDKSLETFNKIKL